MTTVQNIEKAVAQLPPEELAAFRAWFEAFDAARFDEKIDRDAASRKLNRLADEALAGCQRALNAPQFGACKIPHLAGPAISRESDGQLHSWVVGRAAEAAA